ncbi:dihydroxyacetone kinase phosphoryl donor subunit DhaM [Microbacterium sp. RD1]|uniref:dihydroxyacetone kinase phosphoryl donor subunit DhaM n=1 Tax=Microbacterium sp. RD1 TaxID=3457313 RepID=UPI003FA5A6B7
MIGIVAVSHSAPLAAAAVELALQMAGHAPPRVEIAAGTSDGDLGTDAVAIAAAIDRADSGDGVLVFMDLGSAILSAETALEFGSTARVVLSPAPFVEGLVAGVVGAAAGASLDDVAADVGRALELKRAQLGDTAPPPSRRERDDSSVDGGEASFEAVLTNPSGLHARPAASFARTAADFDAAVLVADLDSAAPPAAGDSVLALMALGVRQGSRIRVTARGRQAAEARDTLREMVESGFGET